jgi:hypothetical protein
VQFGAGRQLREQRMDLLRRSTELAGGSARRCLQLRPRLSRSRGRRGRDRKDGVPRDVLREQPKGPDPAGACDALSHFAARPRDRDRGEVGCGWRNSAARSLRCAQPRAGFRETGIPPPRSGSQYAIAPCIRQPVSHQRARPATTPGVSRRNAELPTAALALRTNPILIGVRASGPTAHSQPRLSAKEWNPANSLQPPRARLRPRLSQR